MTLGLIRARRPHGVLSLGGFSGARRNIRLSRIVARSSCRSVRKQDWSVQHVQYNGHSIFHAYKFPLLSGSSFIYFSSPTSLPYHQRSTTSFPDIHPLYHPPPFKLCWKRFGYRSP
ncbi:unnamed protein product [Pylaiella littoralis]